VPLQVRLEAQWHPTRWRELPNGLTDRRPVAAQMADLRYTGKESLHVIARIVDGVFHQGDPMGYSLPVRRVSSLAIRTCWYQTRETSGMRRKGKRIQRLSDDDGADRSAAIRKRKSRRIYAGGMSIQGESMGAVYTWRIRP
jgi:hypothetical protein